MKFGLFHEFPCHGDFSQREVFSESFELVDEAERLGTDAIWLAEYHFMPQRSVLSSPVTIATAIASRTSRVRIGLAVQVLPLANLVRMAEEIATLDHISQGRLDFGIGRSTFAFIYEGFGMDFGESRGRFDECLEIILKGWTEEQFSYEGDFYKFENSCVVPRPYQQPHPPISVGVTSAETFPMVGRMGYPILINPSRVFALAELKDYITDYQKARKDAGHEGEGAVGLRVPVYLAETAEAAYEEPRPSTVEAMGRIGEIVASTAHGVGVTDDRIAQADRIRAMDYDDWLRDKVVYGTPEAAVDRFRELQEDLGLTEIIYEVNFGCQIPHERQVNTIRLLTEQVAPHLN